VQLGMLRRLGPALDLEVDYLRLERLDRYLGYDDYTQDVLRVRGVFRFGSRFDVALAALARAYDYPNAFAFNEPAAGALEHDEADVEITANFRLNRRWSLFAELAALDVTSTDARAAYTRTRMQLGAAWRR
jgi:predicted extracellular nuclease